MTRSKIISAALSVALLAPALSLLGASSASADTGGRPAPGEFGYSTCWEESYWPQGTQSLVDAAAIDPFDMRTWPVLVSGPSGWERIGPADERITWSTTAVPIDSALNLPQPSIAADGYALFSAHCLTPSQSPPRSMVLSHSLDAHWQDGTALSDDATPGLNGPTTLIVSAEQGDRFTVDFNMTVSTPPKTTVIDQRGTVVRFSDRDLEFSGGAYNEDSVVQPEVTGINGMVTDGFECSGTQIAPDSTAHAVSCRAMFELTAANPPGVPGVTASLSLQPQWTVPSRGTWQQFGYAPNVADIRSQGWLFEVIEAEQAPEQPTPTPAETEPLTDPEPTVPPEPEQTPKPSTHGATELAETGAGSRPEMGVALGTLLLGALILATRRSSPARRR